MNKNQIISTLKDKSDPSQLPNLEKFGINTSKAFGIRIPELRQISKQIGKNHQQALELWETKIHEARILASMIAERERVTLAMMDSWVKDFNSWDLCDQVCNNLFVYTRHNHIVVNKWINSKEEFTRRAGFVMIATLAVHDKKADDQVFIDYLAKIKNASDDERNFVKKAVNWALRQIGKRNANLNTLAIDCAKSILVNCSDSAKWIAKNALTELTSSKVQQKLLNK